MREIDQQNWMKKKDLEIVVDRFLPREQQLNMMEETQVFQIIVKYHSIGYILARD